MKKILISIIALTLMMSIFTSTAFAYTTLPLQSSDEPGTYTVDVGVTRTIVGRASSAFNSSITGLTMSFLGTLQGSNPTQKTIAVAIYDSVYTVHRYKITTIRAGYTNTKLSELSTTSYTWQTVGKVDSYNSHFAGARQYSYYVTSTIETSTLTGNTQGYYSNISIITGC